MNSGSRVLTFLLLTTMAVPGLCPAATLSASDDVTTRSDSTNYDEFTLGGSAYAGLFVKNDGSRSWLEFTLNDTASDTATLYVYNYWTANGVNYDLKLLGAPYNFTETALTGSTAPSASSWTTIVSSFHVDDTAQWYALDITDFYNAHLNEAVTFVLLAVSGSGDGPIFVDREGTGGYSQFPYIEWTVTNTPPVIQEVTPDPDSAYGNTEYTRQLVLTQGSEPVSWSVVQGPAGLAVDSTGNVTGWTPSGSDVGSSFTLEIQADNTFGSDTETWQVQVEAVSPPIIREISPDPGLAFANTEYTQQLELAQGSGVSWSVDAGPTGLQVDSTGRVNGWTPQSSDAGTTFPITIRATNAGGADTETWDVRVSSTSGVTFPGASWQFKTPAELGLDEAKLDQFVASVGGVGCITRQGYMVKTWGDQSSKGDWASAAKPVISTMLFYAVEEGLVPSVHDHIANWGWALNTNDQPMEFYHLANMTSGYSRGEAPGEAWAYNDYAIRLYAETLFTRVYGATPDAATTASTRLGALQFEDGSIFSSREGRGLSTTPRDFARIGWFWSNRGNWNGTQLLARSYFDDYMTVHVPAELPRTSTSGTDYLNIGTYGGGTDQTAMGPGLYGFNWWFNPDSYMWADVPADAFQANGHWGAEVLTIIPSLSLVVACRGNNGSDDPGNPYSPMNLNLKLLVEACPVFNPNPPVAAASANITAGRAPLDVHFDGTASSDPDGPIAAYQWDFDGDGIVDAAGATADYQYTTAGLYVARLIVTDSGGENAEDTVVISVSSEQSGTLIADPDHPAWFKYSDGGPFFMNGPGDPEGFLYRGTRNADGTRNGDQITLINKLAATGANCIYMIMVRTNGGDGAADENPFEGSNINNAVDPDILAQWETWFTAMDNAGITPYLLFYDDNAQPFGYDLNNGQLDTREAAFIDAVVNAFEHHRHLIWCVAEEYAEALSNAHVAAVAARIKQQDDNNHPVTVHQLPGTAFAFNGNANFDQFSMQLSFSGAAALHDACVTAWNNVGGLKNVNLAEFAFTEAMPTGTELRKTAWATALGGAYGMYLYMDIETTAVSDLETCGRLIQFMESTRFNETQPYDSLARGNTDYVLASPGEVYIAYGDLGTSLGLHVQAGAYQVVWYDTIDGDLADGGVQAFTGGDHTFTKPAGIGSEAVVYLSSFDAAVSDAGQQTADLYRTTFQPGVVTLAAIWPHR